MPIADAVRWLFRSLDCSFLHRVHGNISSVALADSLEIDCTAHKKVPPENNSNMPVANSVPCPPTLSFPKTLTNIQVVNAATGAARLNTIRCALVCLLVLPCFSSTDVSPNAAGALCIISARNTMSPVLACDTKDDAANAIPSAAACITSPIVVAELFGAVLSPNSSRESSTDNRGELVRWGPSDRLAKEICMGFLGARREASRGTWSIRYIIIKPAISAKPTHACGSLSGCSSCRSDRRLLRPNSSARGAAGDGESGTGAGLVGECVALLYSVSIPSGMMMIKQLPTSLRESQLLN